jgi:hypothetical protein
MASNALYFPYIDLPQNRFTNTALLYWNQVITIARVTRSTSSPRRPDQTHRMRCECRRGLCKSEFVLRPTGSDVPSAHDLILDAQFGSVPAVAPVAARPSTIRGVLLSNAGDVVWRRSLCNQCFKTVTGRAIASLQLRTADHLLAK